MTRLAKLVLLSCTLTVFTACSDGNDTPKALAPLLDRYVLTSETSVPEGVTFDPQERAFFATSIQEGSITRIAADGTETVFREIDNRAGFGGAKVDAQARRLWVCARGVDGMDNRVWVFNVDTGVLVMEFLLGAITTNGSCNDLVLDSAGVAYVTDPANPFIYRLDPVTEEGSVLATDPLFNDVTGFGLGLNGIEVTADGNDLIVAKFAPPSFIRVSLPDAATISLIALSGDALPSPDGLEELDGDIYAVSNAAVSRLRLNDDRTAGEVVTRSQINGLSTAAVAEGSLYAIKSEITNFVIMAPLDTPFEIFRVDLEAFDQ